MNKVDFRNLIDLEPAGPDRWIGHSPDNGWPRVFGGQVVAQALTAAQRTVEDARPVHSLHGYFILGGDPKSPIQFDVEHVRDGRSFTTRRVVASQRREQIFILSCSFQVHEEGLEHETPSPERQELRGNARPPRFRRARRPRGACDLRRVSGPHRSDRDEAARHEPLSAAAAPAKLGRRNRCNGSDRQRSPRRSAAACRRPRLSLRYFAAGFGARAAWALDG